MKGQLLIIIALAVGGALAVQGMLNAQLGKALAHPLQASLISFSVALLCLLVFMLSLGIKLPPRAELTALPWYLYTGGLLGVIYVTSVLVLIPRIGVASTVMAIFVGQMLLSICADHFGWFNTPIRAMNLSRTGGCVLLVTGLYLIQAKA